MQKAGTVEVPETDFSSEFVFKKKFLQDGIICLAELK